MKVLKKLLIGLLSFCIILSVTACGNENNDNNNNNNKPNLPAMADPIDDNYRVFYQIFVGSFSDSNGDGIGDLRGIINRMDYLNDGNINSGESLGVQGLWLSPIFKSPTYHKYDAIDYYEIDSSFGTLDDLKELIALCHERNVKIILDLAINHTSIKHQWFENFKNARNLGDTENKYYNYYTCLTKGVAGRTFLKIPGNPYGELYECNFDSAMPELNFDNEDVRQETLDIAKYYLNLGVDGFRFDAVKYIYRDDTASSASFWEWYMGELRNIKPDIYAVGECWSSDTEILDYYSAFNCFNFTTSGAEGCLAMCSKLNLSTEKTAQKISAYTNYITSFLSRMNSVNPNGMYIPFVANHDMDRASGYATPYTFSAQMLANLYILCTGSPIIYYGEEIGMKGTRGSAATDANRRLAMLWGDGDTIADPEGATYDSAKQTNGTVKSQLKDDSSLLRYYQQVIRFRTEYPEIARGSYAILSTTNDYVGGFVISYNGQTSYIIHNTSIGEATVSLSGYDVSSVSSYIGKGQASLKGKTLTISGQTTVMIK